MSIAAAKAEFEKTFGPGSRFRKLSIGFVFDALTAAEIDEHAALAERFDKQHARIIAMIGGSFQPANPCSHGEDI